MDFYRPVKIGFPENVQFSYSREEGLFRRSGRRTLRQHILDSLKKGERLQISHTPDTAKECAAALHTYLTQMKAPVLPKRVQQLLLADNPGIEARIIAHDALGLIRQDVTGLHSELLVALLGLLKHLMIYPPPSEHTELHAPPIVANFLPAFFNLTPNDMVKWQQVASRFNEVIIEAPEYLMRKKRPPRPLNTINDANSLTRSRHAPLLNPFARQAEYRHDYHIGIARSLHRPLAGRLHPAFRRLRA